MFKILITGDLPTEEASAPLGELVKHVVSEMLDHGYSVSKATLGLLGGGIEVDIDAVKLTIAHDQVVTGTGSDLGPPTVVPDATGTETHEPPKAE